MAVANGRKSGGIRFGVGSLAHLLKNRFYIGEVVYRGEVHRGEHEPILARDLFEAVQAKLAANAVARQVRLRGSLALLTGRLFDDRGNRMSPTHANKLGVRYRYYVSHAILQNRKAEAGSIARVPAPEIENARVRRRPQASCSYRGGRAADRPCGPRADRTPCRARDASSLRHWKSASFPRARHRLKPKTPASMIRLPAVRRRPRSALHGRRQASRP